jgi:hypothetical protein
MRDDAEDDRRSSMAGVSPASPVTSATAPIARRRDGRRLALASVVTAALAVTLAGLAAPTSAAADGSAAHQDTVVDCDVYAHYPNVLISSARNMTCRRAARDMRRYRGSIKRRFRTPGGFRCTQQSGVPEGGQWRCVKRRRAYRFEFGD